MYGDWKAFPLADSKKANNKANQMTGLHSLGPVAPRSGGHAVHAPLGLANVTLNEGLFGDWQEANYFRSLPLAIEHLERAGNLANVRLAIAAARRGFRGPPFMDSDIYKTIEAVAWELGRVHDPGLEKFLVDTAGLLASAQEPDGYLNSYTAVVLGGRRYEDLASSHELYCAGHLFQAAVAAHRATGDVHLLTIAERFADHLVEEFLVGGNSGIDGHPEVETALIELYRETGKSAYLDLASHFVENRGYGKIGSSGKGLRYLQDHLPVREADTLVGHVVRALYLEAGIVDLYLESGDDSLLQASIRRWEDMVGTKTYITGGNGSRHSTEGFGDAWELPPDRAYNESCAAIASIHWTWRLLLATGEARYADLIERVLFNAFAASTSSDATLFFYVNPLTRRPDHFEQDDRSTRHPWFSCACCPPNLMRTVATIGHYVASVADDHLYIHQYLPATISIVGEEGLRRLVVATDFPWSGRIDIKIAESPRRPWTLALRIPPWSKETSATINGAPTELKRESTGYALLRRAWPPGTIIQLHFDMEPRVVVPDHHIDDVRGSAALERGPLVYSFEEVDQPDGADLLKVALTPGTAIRATEHASLPRIGRTVTLEVDGATLAANVPATALPYHEAGSIAPVERSPVRLVAVPYFQWDNREYGAMKVWLPLEDK
jgi:uncharacterized protein